MSKKLLMPIIVLIAFSMACKPKSATNTETKVAPEDGNHKVTVTEVLQASAYTYLNVDEEGMNYWIAVNSTEAMMGDVLYYVDFMEMKDFTSKDLNRTFPSVLFVSEISREPIVVEPQKPMAQSTGKITTNKLVVKLEPVAGAITIAEIFADKAKYSGKKITVKGQVVKVNVGIMNRTWVHIQDGTESNGSYDLTITLAEENIEIGQQLVFEGVLAVDKDFGHGYSYDVIMEEAIIKN